MNAKRVFSKILSYNKNLEKSHHFFIMLVNATKNINIYSQNKYLIYAPSKDDEYKEMVYNKHVRDTVTQIFIRNNNVRDCVMFHLDENDNYIRQFPFVKVTLYVEIKEFRKSSDLFNGVAIEDKNGNVVHTWEKKRHEGDWEFYQIEVDNLNLSQFYMGSGIFKIRLKYYCLQNHHFQDWYLRNVMLKFTIKNQLT